MGNVHKIWSLLAKLNKPDSVIDDFRFKKAVW